MNNLRLRSSMNSPQVSGKPKIILIASFRIIWLYGINCYTLYN